MDTNVTSMTTEQTAEPTTPKEWTWNASNAWDDYGTDDERCDRVAWLVAGEVCTLWEDMRSAFDCTYDECYPNQDDAELDSDRHTDWLEGFEDGAIRGLWDEEFGNPGIVRLVREGDRYTLTARDTEGKQGDERRTIHLDPALTDREIRGQVWEFLTAQDPLGKIESICFSHVADLLGEAARTSRTAGH